MKIVSENISSGIEAKSFYLNDLSCIPSKNYDLAIVTSSWDPRCLNIINNKSASIDKYIIILFDDKDEHGHRNNHDDILTTWAKKTSNNISIITGQSTDVQCIFLKLFKHLVSLCVELGRPINVLFDLSVCPRYISLSFLSRGFNNGLIKEIDYIYGECSYPKPIEGVIGIEEVIFTEGEWNTLPVDFMDGNYNPSQKQLFTVSIGFEGNKTLRLINLEDPDKVRLVVPDPGYDSSYGSRVIDANSELIKHEDITENDMIKAHAGDAIDVWIKLYDAIETHKLYEFNQTCLCAGSKPHSLGLALTCLVNPNISLLYCQPQQHTFIKIDPIDKYWIYNIRSITTPN